MKGVNNLIESHLKHLKLKGMINDYKGISEIATEKKLTYEEYLSLLLENEVLRKKNSSYKARVDRAKFPYIKELDSFDFSFQPTLDEKKVIQLSSCDFIDKVENLIFLGPPGVGKTHLAIGYGLKANKIGYRVLFLTVEKLLKELGFAKEVNRLSEKLLHYSRYDLLILDELGYVTIDDKEANLLFQLISMRYENKPIIITSNFPFEEWGKIFPNTLVATAIIDRIIHHSHIFTINGSSFRIKDKINKNG